MGRWEKEKERIIFQQQTLCKVVGMHEEKREKGKFFYIYTIKCNYYEKCNEKLQKKDKRNERKCVKTTCFWVLKDWSLLALRMG